MALAFISSRMERLRATAREGPKTERAVLTAMVARFSTKSAHEGALA